MSFGMEPPVGPFKAETEGYRPLRDVISEHLDLRVGSGLKAEIPIDVGVSDGASNGPGVEEASEMAGDVPVRYAMDRLGRTGCAVSSDPGRRNARMLKWRQFPARCLVSSPFAYPLVGGV